MAELEPFKGAQPRSELLRKFNLKLAARGWEEETYDKIAEGMTLKELAAWCSVSSAELAYLRKHTKLGAIWNAAREDYKERKTYEVEDALLRRAIGGEEVPKRFEKLAHGSFAIDGTWVETAEPVVVESSETITYSAPEVAAIKYVLGNITENWRDRHEVSHTGTVNIAIVDDVLDVTDSQGNLDIVEAEVVECQETLDTNGLELL